MELKQRVVASPDLQTAFGGSTLSALQNTYSLSISYAQARVAQAFACKTPNLSHLHAACRAELQIHPSNHTQPGRLHLRRWMRGNGCFSLAWRRYGL